MGRINMFLKRLESKGFKSFAERVKVEFVPGVTAVVGPNGSGKSNITDAIRWVLGEQSVRSLRGLTMEDIIFQGSDTRNPLNVAEVTLTLDNSSQKLPLDYKEVSVTRRVYRSGQSEFYINKQSCRLKDIIDLFIDSGLGREAFSIIGQGKVEEVLSSKAEERRVIFEEAAGVLKYKQRKQKAEFKLSETKDNLNRVDDIIYEIEQQIDPLYKQSQIAKKYIEQSELLKEKEISLLITEIENLHEEWQKLLQEIEGERLEEIKIKTLIQKREASLEGKRQSLQLIDEEIEKLQTHLLTTTQQLEQYEGKKQVWSERTKHFTENKQKLIQQKNDTLSMIEKLKAQLEEEERKLANLHEIKEKTRGKIKKLQTKLTSGRENISDNIEELKSEYIEILNQQAAKRNEKQTITQQIQKTDLQNVQHDEKFQDLITTRQQQAQEKEKVLKEYEQLDHTYHQKQKSIQQLKNNLKQEQERYDISQKNLYKGYQMIAKLNSRKEMLEEMRDGYQGFFYGVKNILKAKNKNILTNIHGAVIELIDVPEKYISAIETILSGQAQNVVVTDDQAAREAISWLKQTNNGRATFLPLQSIQPRFLPENLLAQIKSHPGYVGIAADLVKTRSKYQVVVNHLMGNVVITKNLKSANDIARRLNRRYRIVTLDGDIVNPGGAMSGGAKKKSNQSLFTREKDLEEVNNQVQELQSKASAFEHKLSDHKKEIEQLEKNIIKEEKLIKDHQKRLQETYENSQKIDMKLNSIDEKMAIYKNEQNMFEQDKAELHHRHTKLTKDLADIEQRLLLVQEEIDRLTQEKKELNNQRDQMTNDLHELQVSLAEQEERIRNQREKTTTIRHRIKELKDQYDHYTIEYDELIDLKKSEETEQDINKAIEEKRTEKELYTTHIQQKRAERSQQTQYIEDEDRELRQLNKQHHVMIQAIQQKEVKSNRLDVDLENRLSQLQTDYTITYEKARTTYKKIHNIDEVKAEVAEIKQAIKGLGAVNLGSIDEYKRISERYDFLTEQKDDLVEAKETLHNIIAEMDDVMRKRFGDTFLQIKQEFSVVFKELFGGGHAELKLTDPQNMLETGIEIIAQPPGKKLQHLGLLSGGEKALTAIALLFSILRVRPVPFCVLDEVEAALDEANVVRFAKYLRMHSEDTQFIVITHRKGTMEEADVLYGVTMQESGVSRLVSVQLEDSLELISS